MSLYMLGMHTYSLTAVAGSVKRVYLAKLIYGKVAVYALAHVCFCYVIWIWPESRKSAMSTSS